MLTYADVELVGSCQVLLVVYEALSYHFPISGWWFWRDAQLLVTVTVETFVFQSFFVLFLGSCHGRNGYEKSDKNFAKI